MLKKIDTYLRIKDKYGSLYFSDSFRGYETACRFAYQCYNKKKYFWHFYRIIHKKNGNIELKLFCTCQGGQDHERTF